MAFACVEWIRKHACVHSLAGTRLGFLQGDEVEEGGLYFDDDDEDGQDPPVCICSCIIHDCICTCTSTCVCVYDCEGIQAPRNAGARIWGAYVHTLGHSCNHVHPPVRVCVV